LAGGFYAALAGFAIPTQRALVMLAVAMAGILWSRRRSPSYILAVALLLVLAIDPLAVLAAGFWLSFAAVALILYVIHPGRARATWRERWRAWTGMQWAIAVGMLPLMLVLFQQTSVSGPIANLIAIPVIESLVIPLTLLGVTALVALPESIAAGLFLAAAWCLDKLWYVLEALAALDHTQWVQHTPPAWTVACAVVGVVVLLAPRGFPARWVGALWLAPMLWLRPPGPAPGEVWFTLLDVGQGLAAVARTATHTLVYDSGARWSSRFDAGRAVVAPFLRHAGVARIDTLIVSHAHNDHIGGAASLLEALPVERLLSSVPDLLAGAEHCRAGQRWEWDGVRFEILHPPADAPWRDNNASCVLRIADSRGAILLPGDIASTAERALVAASARDLNAEVLVAPHHGSKTSSTAVFVDAVSPRLVLYPVGYRNRHRHPHPAVVERYAWVGAEAHESPRHGAMTVRFGPDGPELSGYREQRPRYWWHRPKNSWEASP
ncbi:MAG: DNA internalization-related competence protein ComEC/Rec2, partial [Gammaproteobacteria bacterium]|nr:DNA internalization-related competence protein ComEC/Rec2 [Gammaproteobacteria bacterium]